MDQKHYVCLGDCEAVSEKPGTCDSAQCISLDQNLVECHCSDGKHNDLKLPETDQADSRIV